MKKFFISSVIILVFSISVFFVGWIQFAVPVGNYGVLISKTSGIDSRTIKPGEFRWQWEKLLPTNCEIRSFSLYPHSKTQTVSGSLPSAELYSIMMGNNTDFSYKFEVTVSLNANEDCLPIIIQKNNIKNQDELNEFLDKESSFIAESVIKYMLDHSSDNSYSAIESVSNLEEIEKHISLSKKYPLVKVENISINSFKMPDMTVYNMAKETYSKYQEQTKIGLMNIASEQAKLAANDYLQIERFAKWGKILKEYPLLIDFLKVSAENNQLEKPSFR